MWFRFVSIFFSFLLVTVSLQSSSLVLAANHPAFNNLEGDQEFLRAAVSGTDIFTDPIETNPGDESEVELYYHNTVVDTVAKNTRLKITLPTNRGEQHSIKGTILSDSTAPVSGTLVAGQEVGSSNLTISAPDNTAIIFVPGSVHWFPDRAFPTGTGNALPNNQNGDDIVTSGISIGDIKGGFNNAGVLRFKVKTVIPPPATDPSLSIIQKVRKEDSKDAFYGKVSVKPGTAVEYQVSITNAKDAAAAQNVALRIVLPVGIQYKGSPMLQVKENKTPLAEGIAGRNGITLFATLAPGESGQVTFNASTSPDLKVGSCGVSKAVVSAKGLPRALEGETSLCFQAADPAPLAATGGGSDHKGPSPLPAILFFLFSGALLWFYKTQTKRTISG